MVWGVQSMGLIEGGVEFSLTISGATPISHVMMADGQVRHRGHALQHLYIKRAK